MRKLIMLMALFAIVAQGHAQQNFPGESQGRVPTLKTNLPYWMGGVKSPLMQE